MSDFILYFFLCPIIQYVLWVWDFFVCFSSLCDFFHHVFVYVHVFFGPIWLMFFSCLLFYWILKVDTGKQMVFHVRFRWIARILEKHYSQFGEYLLMIKWSFGSSNGFLILSCLKLLVKIGIVFHWDLYVLCNQVTNIIDQLFLVVLRLLFLFIIVVLVLFPVQASVEVSSIHGWFVGFVVHVLVMEKSWISGFFVLCSNLVYMEVAWFSSNRNYSHKDPSFFFVHIYILKTKGINVKILIFQWNDQNFQWKNQDPFILYCER